MTQACQYDTPTVPEGWADSRHTDDAVAMAIHAIASADRTAEAIWEEPTPEESHHVAMAVSEYVRVGLYELGTGFFAWGQEFVCIGGPGLDDEPELDDIEEEYEHDEADDGDGLSARERELNERLDMGRNEAGEWKGFM